MSNTDVIALQNATTLSRAGETTPGNGAELGKSDFLNLLMTQLSNQDPMNPQDNEAFIAQLTQFANLEQLQNMSGQFDDLLQVTSASNSANAVSLLGSDVRVANNTFKGPEATVYYQLPENAAEVTLEIRDRNGSVVQTFREGLNNNEGLHEVNIEDLNNDDYFFTVVARDGAGTEIKPELSILEHVDGVNFQNQIPVLITSSGRNLSAAEVVEIRKPNTTPAAAASSSEVDSELPPVSQAGEDGESASDEEEAPAGSPALPPVDESTS